MGGATIRAGGHYPHTSPSKGGGQGVKIEKNSNNFIDHYQAAIISNIIISVINIQ